MKKFALALLCIVSVAFFASCSKDDDPKNPSISVYAPTTEFVQDGATVDLLADSIKFGFQMASNADSQKELASLRVVIAVDTIETEWANLPLSGTTFTYTDSFSFSAKEIICDAVITATVTDADNNTATASITLHVNDPELEVTDFEWYRHGGDDATGLAEYGLEWKSNLKDVFAQIKPMNGYTLYELNSEDWINTQTINGKTLLLTNVATEGQSIPVFNKISAFTPASNLDYVLATINFTTYDAHILHITSSEVTSFKGTDVKIFGQAK